MKAENIHVFSSSYKGFFSIVMESEKVRIEVIPEIGGKLVSIVYKPTAKEWLIDSGDRPLRKPLYGSTFTNWDVSGWDECFPTITPCQIEADGDINLPDHGEVWSLPWDYELESDAVTCTVRSPMLPYSLTRKISFITQDRVRMEYGVKNEGTFPIPFLWVAHPQFMITAPTNILLPPEMDEVLCVFGNHLQQAGKTYKTKELSILSPVLTGEGKKFYYPGKVSTGWSGLQEQESGLYLLLVVSPEIVPYGGLD